MNHPALIQNIIVERLRDIGDFSVKRVLPTAARRMVGPFIFLDQMGPLILAAGKGVDVRPHPHIGLSTLTYLFKGSMVHRDSLGSLQSIEPGDINWMTAGRGIVHSERSDNLSRRQSQELHGLQSWVALPRQNEETKPTFTHYSSKRLPETSGEGIDLKVIAGTIDTLTSPVATCSPLFYGDLVLAAGSTYRLNAAYEERAVYLLEGAVEIDGIVYEHGRLLAFGPGEIVMKASRPARLIMLGGDSLDGPRHIYWNFVSSSLDRIEQAKEDWRRHQFGLPIPGETEFIPLPD